MNRHLSWNSVNIDINYVFGGPFLSFNVVEGQIKSYSNESKDSDMSKYMMSIWRDFTEQGYVWQQDYVLTFYTH